MEPDSLAQLDALTALERDRHIRRLLASAKGDLGWLHWPLRLLQLGGLLGVLILFRLDAVTFALGFGLVFSLWGVEIGLERRLDAIVALLELQRTARAGEADENAA